MEAVVAQAIGTAISAAGSIQQGKASEAASKYEAEQMVQQAKARYAQGTREAQEARRRADLMESNARAAMAGSGGVATDPGAIEQLSKIREVGDYNALAAMFEAESEGKGLRQAAKSRLHEGRLAKKTAFSTALGKAMSLIPGGFGSTGTSQFQVDIGALQQSGSH